MKPINAGKALLGGAVAALIINVIESAMMGGYLKQDWANALTALGRPGTVTGGAIAIYWSCGLLEGIIAVWLYAALVSRYGTGSKTAAKAGLVVWTLVSVLPNLSQIPAGLLPSRLVTICVLTDFFAILLATTFGALLYREEGAPSGQTVAAKA